MSPMTIIQIVLSSIPAMNVNVLELKKKKKKKEVSKKWETNQKLYFFGNFFGYVIWWRIEKYNYLFIKKIGW